MRSSGFADRGRRGGEGVAGCYRGVAAQGAPAARTHPSSRPRCTPAHGLPASGCACSPTPQLTGAASSAPAAAPEPPLLLGLLPRPGPLPSSFRAQADATSLSSRVVATQRPRAVLLLPLPLLLLLLLPPLPLLLPGPAAAATARPCCSWQLGAAQGAALLCAATALMLNSCCREKPSCAQQCCCACAPAASGPAGASGGRVAGMQHVARFPGVRHVHKNCSRCRSHSHPHALQEPSRQGLGLLHSCFRIKVTASVCKVKASSISEPLATGV
jgi:hypothetical protein